MDNEKTLEQIAQETSAELNAAAQSIPTAAAEVTAAAEENIPTATPVAAPAYQQPTYQMPTYNQPVQTYYAQPAANVTPARGIVSLALGIAAIALCWCYGIFGIGFGIPAIILGKKQLNLLPTDGRAKAGKITGIIGIILGVIFLFVWIFVIGAIASNYRYY